MGRVLVALGMVASMVGLVGAQTRSFEAYVRAYRGGDIDAAVSGVKATLSSSPEIPGDILDWIQHATLKQQSADLEAALLLHSEILVSMRTGAATATDTSVPTLIKGLHSALRMTAQRTPFLRQWYLLMEAARQGHPDLEIKGLEYADTGLKVFPNDAELLLACGSLHEVRWWNDGSNLRRDPSGPELGGHRGDRNLRAAANCLRLSVGSDPGLYESRLRLGRVLMLLGDLEAAAAEFGRLPSSQEDPAFRYLGQLFEGELQEQRGDSAAATARYHVAIELMPQAQSARLAAAFVQHAQGQRQAAGEAVSAALSQPPTAGDPWWLYQRGQWWRFESYLRAARALVRP